MPSVMDVFKIAKLARLQITNDEAKVIGQELESILLYVKELEAVDLSNVAPTAHAAGAPNALREDSVREGLSAEALFRNAPQMQGGAFAVPKVIE